jgi:alpha-D-xyloside xylohydrolase
MLGDSLLVAPVFSREGQVAYYLPAGRWTNFFTGEITTGPRWVRETHSMLSLPLMVRPNSLLALGSHDERPDYEYAEGVTLQLYELADGAQAVANIPSPAGRAGATFAAKRDGRRITVERRGAASGWRLLMVGIEAAASVEGGGWVASPSGALVTPNEGAERITVSL